MTIVKIKSNDKNTASRKVEKYSKFKSARMVYFANTFKGLSQSKVKMVLDNAEELRKFVDGAYDDQIDQLSEDEALMVE